jgi:hypothetical protein
MTVGDDDSPAIWSCPDSTETERNVKTIALKWVTMKTRDDVFLTQKQSHAQCMLTGMTATFLTK